MTEMGSPRAIGDRLFRFPIANCFFFVPGLVPLRLPSTRETGGWSWEIPSSIYEKIEINGR